MGIQIRGGNMAPKTVDQYLADLASDNLILQREAAYFLRNYRDERILPALKKVKDSPDKIVRINAEDSIRKLLGLINPEAYVFLGMGTGFLTVLVVMNFVLGHDFILVLFIVSAVFGGFPGLLAGWLALKWTGKPVAALLAGVLGGFVGAFSSVFLLGFAGLT
jgi:hypothetical protein